MIIFYILLGLLVLSKLRFKFNGYYSDYLSFDTTNAIKGIFIALVFINHAIPYIYDSGYVFDDSIVSKLFLISNSFVGQWIVAMFLFYSGYGVMESISKKGQEYVNSLPSKRILTTLVNFDIAVALFAIISFFTPNNYTIKDYLLSLIGWESVGNSNWYIFVIMICYSITYLCFRNFSIKKKYIHASSVGCFIFFTILLLSILKPSWWYDTMLCFATGIFYSIFRQHVESIAQRYYWQILSLLVILMFFLIKISYNGNGLVYNIFCIVFCLLIIILSMKIRINNPILIWAGKNLFPLYIYQRIPMIIFSSICGGAFVSSYPVLFTSICLLITLLFAYFYKYWSIKL